jgi:hypothetical protein
MKRTRALLGIATGLGLIVVGAPAQAAPPEPFTFILDVPVGFEFGSCDFPVRIVATGKTKSIQTPTGRTIGVAANTTATVTRIVNGEPGESVEYSINGSFIQTTDAAGNVTTKATGRNLLTDPEAGVVVTSGNFTFTFNAEGELVEGLSGTGRIIDVCAELA